MGPLCVLLRTLDRGQRLAALAALPELVAARPDRRGGWELAVVRHGRLAAAGVAARWRWWLRLAEGARTGYPGTD